MNGNHMNNRPSTYFLQEAIDRGLAAIDARLDREQGNRPFFMIELSPEPCLTHDIWDLGDMCSRYVDAFILGRQVTGDTRFQDDERDLRAMLYGCDPYLEPFMAGRMLIAYVDLYLQDRSETNQKRIDDLVSVVRSKLTFQDDYAYYFKAPDGWTSIESPIWGSFLPYPTYPIGGIMLALARYLEDVSDPVCEDLLERLTVFVLRESGTFASDGAYYGHTHSGGILTAAAAILRRAVHIGDTGRIDFLKRTIGWTLVHCSSWGWVPDGLGSPDPSGETCSLVDALHLLLVAACHLNPAYYEIIERFARNQLIENQYRDPNIALPAGDFQNRQAVSRAIDGSWASWSLPNSLDNGLQSIEGCCLGAGIRGCFLVWDSVVELRDDTVRVNMAFSRNSLWAEIISYMPYTGRIDILMHDSHDLQVRVHSWVPIDDLAVTVNGQPVEFAVDVHRYIHIDQLNRGDAVSIQFPISTVVEEEEETVSDMVYTVQWRGDTVTGIEPQGAKYPLYRRAWAETSNPPMVPARYQDQTGGPVTY
ncbi:MAG: hypothetical protein ACYC27_05160 [Armatimonadota bacterium]